MHLVSPLAGGVVGAENGVARIYRRGTATRATVYTDFEASAADSSGEDIALDSTGGAVIYVNELVQVRVFDSLGELIRDFVAGEGAYAVEVISPAFTGTDYVSGQQGASRPTDVGAVLDRWLASAGAIDWKVLYSGSATELQNALGSLYGMFFNVKSPEFGAKGDGSTDDAASWQAAHDAADAAGGGIVFVPPGDYIHGSTISWKAGIHLFCIPDQVVIRQTGAGNPNIAIVGTTGTTFGSPTYIIGATFDSTISNSASQLTVGHGAAEDVTIDSCVFNATANCVGAGVVVGSSIGTTRIRNCIATARAGVRLFYDTTSASDDTRMFVEDCWLKSFLGGAGSELVKSNNNELRVTRCRFLTQSSTGNVVCITVANTNYSLIVSGCNFKDSAGGAGPYAVGIIAGGRYQVDDSNYFGPGVFPYLQSADTDILSEGLSYAALRKEGTGTTTGVTHTVTDYVETFFLRSTNVAAPTVTLPKIFYYGQSLRLMIWNNSGSDWGATSPTLVTSAGLAVMWNPADSPLAFNGFACTITLVAANRAGAPRWVTLGKWGLAG